MKPSYNNITVGTGARTSGLYSIKVVPREWLAADPVADVITGVVSDVPLKFGKEWIDLFFTELSYDYNETPKSNNKAGDYFEVTAGGSINELTPELQRTIETLRYHEFVAIVQDKNDRVKVIGDTVAGMQLQMDYKQSNSNGGTEISTIKLSMEVEDRPPFYNEPFDSGSGSDS